MASRRARPDGRTGCNRGICTAQAKGGAKSEWLPGRLGAFGQCGCGISFENGGKAPTKSSQMALSNSKDISKTRASRTSLQMCMMAFGTRRRLQNA